ncbi:GNAT family N-acetyltransferase [Macrococcus sp. DPC7161]|uniref:GNAT family N-acetyltransferase n=1 Tax=Macrococcus sp. DPC7161 TaxID=2507060 RepID=UPI00100B2A0F|nr:GNAT family N-acetyltransferase [Macrococcus sp. DPC7161]RXK18438.1 GNAT family N-acetyltransferase [Macrococcus sp. DPC7161]
MIEMKSCTIDDLKSLQQIAYQTFDETFRPQNDDAVMDAYLKDAFTDDKMTNELNNPYSQFYFIKVNQEIAGYLKVNERDAQTEPMSDEHLEIERIYVLNSYQKQGLGKVMYEKAINIAKSKGKSKIWLGVWEKNENALGFYKSKGFKQIDEHTFMMGHDAQTDYIMEKDLLKGE